MGWALVRIVNGAHCLIDRSFFKWPPSIHDERAQKTIKVTDDCVFIAQKQIIRGQPSWECRAPGAGQSGLNYGNGAIDASDVEMLTPLLGYQPSEDERREFAANDK